MRVLLLFYGIEKYLWQQRIKIRGRVNLRAEGIRKFHDEESREWKDKWERGEVDKQTVYKESDRCVIRLNARSL